MKMDTFWRRVFRGTFEKVSPSPLKTFNTRIKNRRGRNVPASFGYSDAKIVSGHITGTIASASIWAHGLAHDSTTKFSAARFNPRLSLLEFSLGAGERVALIYHLRYACRLLLGKCLFYIQSPEKLTGRFLKRPADCRQNNRPSSV